MEIKSVRWNESPTFYTHRLDRAIDAAVEAASAAGAMVAYGPVQQGDTGIWAILIHGGIQVGLWQDATVGA